MLMSKMKITWSLIFLCCIAYSARQTEGARILGVFPFHGYSHFVMFREVARALADKGHQIDVIGHFPLKKPYPNYRDIIDLSSQVDATVNNMTLEFVTDMSASAFPNKFIHFAGTQICELLGLPELQKLIRNPPTDPPYDLVIVESFVANCYFAFGRHLKVPLVAMSTSAAFVHMDEALGNPMNPAHVKLFQDGQPDAMNFWQRLTNTVITSAFSIGFRYLLSSQVESVRKYFGPDMPEISDLNRDVSLLLVNTHSSLYGIRPSTPAVVEIAGVHVQDDGTELPADAKKWLDDSKDGFIYMSFGSMLKIESFPAATLAELYAGFEQIKPIRVLMKIAKPKELPPGIPNNVKTVSWAPQVKVLQHKNIRAFVTHGGLMGIQEAITYGVPLIGVPSFADQPMNIQICATKGAAVSIDSTNITTENFVTAVNTVVKNSSYQTAMKKLSYEFLDRPMSARDTATYWIEYILRHGPDSLRSTAPKLTWWQLALFDVYAFLISALFLVLYASKLVLCAIIRRCCSKKSTSTVAKKHN